jgi:hypothetical protein
MAYFPLTYLASLAIYRVIDEKRKFSRLSKILLVAISSLLAIAITGLTLAILNKEWLINSGLIKDRFAVANLAADVNWTGWEMMVLGVLGIGVLGFFFIKKPHLKIITLFTASIVFIFLTITIFTPRIEGYSQRAALDFYRERATEDCYIRTLGFKSYAHLFYGKMMPRHNPLYYENDWLLTGKIDKPVYFVYRNTKKGEISGYNLDLTFLYEKNGFIFAARYPEKPNKGL